MSYFRKDANFIYLDVNSCEFYIPAYYFDEKYKFAVDEGKVIHCMGVFETAFFDSNGKLLERKMLNLPTWIDISVYESENKKIKLPDDIEETEYRVITYYKNMKIMPCKIVKDGDNVEGYIDFILKGKIPHNIKYSKVLALWFKNQRINSVSLGVPSVELEMILSVFYRYINDPTKKFSTIIGDNPNTSEYDYIMKNVRQICQYTSTYAAVTFEDIDSMITSSLNRTKRGDEEIKAPTESILKL